MEACLLNEIKFKGKRMDNGEWIYGLYVLDCSNGSERHSIGIIDNNRQVLYEVIPETIAQYIGFKDKDNKDIYDGDILYVYYEGDNFNVGYKEYVVKTPNIYFDIAAKRLKSINGNIICAKIIGNIHA